MAHWQEHGAREGRSFPGAEETTDRFTGPDYAPIFRPGAFTGAAYTPVEGGDFDRIESNLYEGTKSKLKSAYDQAIARQREELSQSGALNSPAQYLEGSARSSMDRSYIERNPSTSGKGCGHHITRVKGPRSRTAHRF
jgi:hypothetical protein